MTATMQHPAFHAAHRVAPLPESAEDATTSTWTRHYAALAFAAHAAFYDAMKTPSPELDTLITIAVTATAAARSIGGPPDIGEELWNLTPELGALNGEYEHWLIETLDNLGVNPADIDPRYNGADFRSPRAKEATA